MTEYLTDVTVADGKYTVRQDKNGHLYALRHGEPWSRRLVGDKLVLALAQEVAALRAQLGPPTITLPPPPDHTCFICHAKMDVPTAYYAGPHDGWDLRWNCPAQCDDGDVMEYPFERDAIVGKADMERAGFTIEA